MVDGRTNYSISIVIPAYNEEANIEEVVLGAREVLRSLADRYEILIMNDSSRDRTGEIVEDLAKRFPGEVRTFHHKRNQGTNLSLVELFRAAKMELVFFLPADKQVLPREIRKYLAVVEKEGADVVLGWRRRRADPFYRAFFNGAYRLVLKIFLGLTYQDAAASDLYKKSVLDQIQMESRGRLLQAEIAAKASAMGYRVREIAIDHYPRTAGKQTGIKPKTAWLSFVDLLRLGLKIRKIKRANQEHSLVR